MRKSTAAVLAIGSVFALTAAAATAISVTGPFDPAAGSAPATTCDIGDTTIDSLTDGTNLLGFTLSTTNDTSSDPSCTGADIWLRVGYRDATNSLVYSYAKIPADADYTDPGTDLYLNDGDAHDPGVFFSEVDLTNSVLTMTIADEAIVDTTVLVIKGTPSNFAGVACYRATGGSDMQLAGPINTLDNMNWYVSTDGSCSGGVQPNSAFRWAVQADNADAADTLCRTQASILDPAEPHLVDYWPSAPADWFLCIED